MYAFEAEVGRHHLAGEHGYEECRDDDDRGDYAVGGGREPESFEVADAQPVAPDEQAEDEQQERTDEDESVAAAPGRQRQSAGCDEKREHEEPRLRVERLLHKAPCRGNDAVGLFDEKVWRKRLVVADSLTF